MGEQISQPSLARRLFMSRIGVGITAAGAALNAAPAAAQAQSAVRRFQPAVHSEDDWFDSLPGKHRLVFDTTMPDGLGSALLYANNFFVGNQSGYKLGDADIAVVLVLRHFSTPFAYNDAMWAKYGAAMAQSLSKVAPTLNLTDPQTKQPPKINIYNSAAHVAALPSLGTTIDTVLNRGVHLAVCQMATQFISGQIAQVTSGNADAIYKDLAANLVKNSHLVPAGIVAVNRAQERGYTFAYTG
jgi:intracellular sulfur oxidation DsrE/DsrF family protein